MEEAKLGLGWQEVFERLWKLIALFNLGRLPGPYDHLACFLPLLPLLFFLCNLFLCLPLLSSASVDPWKRWKKVRSRISPWPFKTIWLRAEARANLEFPVLAALRAASDWVRRRPRKSPFLHWRLYVGNKSFCMADLNQIQMECVIVPTVSTPRIFCSILPQYHLSCMHSS